MADRIDKATRSRIMSKIRSVNTKIELRLRKELWKRGYRGYRLSFKLPGKPDLVFPKKKVVVFIDGDFWHGYNWKVLGKIPPKEYWQKKLNKNMERDKKNTKILERDGWIVLRIWEHELLKDLEKSVKRVINALR